MKKKLIDLFPDIANEWNTVKNLPLRVEDVSYGKKIKVWWTCKKNHDYQCRIDQKTGRKSGCPICICNRKMQPVSMTHSHLLEEWHPKNTIRPDQLTSGSHKKIWWLGKCGHEWQSFLHNRTSKQLNSCPYCSNRYVDDKNSLKNICPDIASEWDYNKNKTIPDEVCYKTYKRAFWIGKCGHKWECTIRSRTRKNRPTGCPVCKKSRGESKIELYLINKKINYTLQKRFESCRLKKPLPFDFFIEDKKILIEFQGIQHFESINFGGNSVFELENIKKRDKIKLDWCYSNNYRLISIPYWEIDNIENILEKEILNG